MAVLVTGSSGYIGSELIVSLRRRGHSVIGIDRREPSPGFSPATFVRADLLDVGPLEQIMPKVTDVFHLAAAKDDWGLTPAEYYRDNLDATERLLSVGRSFGVDSWVFYSTVGVLGSGVLARGEDAPYNAETPYAASKVRAEQLFAEYVAENPTARVAVVRPSAVFSPGNPSNNNLYRLVEAIMKRRFLMVGSGDELKATTYLDNLLAATLFIHDHLSPGFNVYNCVEEPVWKTSKLVETIYNCLGRKPGRLYLPIGPTKGLSAILDVLASLMNKDIPVTSARIRKFCTSTNFSGAKLRQLGFEPPVDLEEAVRATVIGHNRSSAQRLRQITGRTPARVIGAAPDRPPVSAETSIGGRGRVA